MRQARSVFQPRLSLTEWCLLVEGRRQGPGEPIAQYALEKAKLCKLCPYRLSDADTVSYLIKGMGRPEHAAALMGNPPLTINGFIEQGRRLEQMGGLASFPGNSTSNLEATVAKMDANLKRMEGLVQAALQRQLPAQNNARNNIGNSMGSGGARDRRPPAEIRCYACQLFGHYARECPNRAPASFHFSENEQAGSSGESRP